MLPYYLGSSKKWFSRTRIITIIFSWMRINLNHSTGVAFPFTDRMDGVSATNKIKNDWHFWPQSGHGSVSESPWYSLHRVSFRFSLTSPTLFCRVFSTCGLTTGKLIHGVTDRLTDRIGKIRRYIMRTFWSGDISPSQPTPRLWLPVDTTSLIC